MIDVTLVSKDNLNFHVKVGNNIMYLMRQFYEELELIDVTLVSNDNFDFSKNLDQINPIAIWENKN